MFLVYVQKQRLRLWLLYVTVSYSNFKDRQAYLGLQTFSVWILLASSPVYDKDTHWKGQTGSQMCQNSMMKNKRKTGQVNCFRKTNKPKKKKTQNQKPLTLWIRKGERCCKSHMARSVIRKMIVPSRWTNSSGQLQWLGIPPQRQEDSELLTQTAPAPAMLRSDFLTPCLWWPEDRGCTTDMHLRLSRFRPHK